MVGWGHYTGGLKEKGRPAGTFKGKDTPGPQYQLDRVTCGQQVQSRFKTAPTPVFGSSKRPSLVGEGVVSPGPMTAAASLTSLPPGPRYSMAGAPWRNEKISEAKSPGPGQYSVCGSLGEQKESTRLSYKGFGFGGSGVTRDMSLPTRKVPGPGHYAWHVTDRQSQPGGKFGSAPQRPVEREELRPGPCQYVIPSTMGATADSRFRTVVAPGFGTPPPIERPHSAGGRIGERSEGPGPGQYDVQKVGGIAIAKKPLSTEKNCQSFQMRPMSAMEKPLAASRNRRRAELDPESLRRALKLTRKGCRVPDISFGVGPQRPVAKFGTCPGPQSYDPESLRRAVSASKSSVTRGVKFGTGPQRHNAVESDKSPGPNAAYAIPSTLGEQGTAAAGPLSMATKKSSGSFFDGIAEFFEDMQKGISSPAAKAAAAAKAAKEKEEAEFGGVWVMMNGLSGKMGVDVAAACLRKGFRIAPYSMSGKGTGELSVSDLEGGEATTVSLVPSDDVQGCEKAVAEMRRRCAGGKIVVVDYTTPSAVNSNADFYAKHGLNFVMGTTGGDREALMAVTEGSGVYAVIAPNMGKQIVALQTAIDNMAREFPGSFSDYKLEITESHQSAKADTSGTAKALAADFATLTGEDYDVESINKVRDREGQLAFGVPEDSLDGHAFHTYSLKSNDGTVEFQFRHNVCGRRMYAEGTADAVDFLAGKATAGAEKRVYNMLDVLREGGM
eukprot:jgi/Undpi1/5107/HiC_scaffold_19.g08459.m1